MAMLPIRLRRSFASPLGFHAGQLHPHQSQICPILPKSFDLCLDACQNAIDPLDRDRESGRSPVNGLSAFLTVQQAHRCLGYTSLIVVRWFHQRLPLNS